MVHEDEKEIPVTTQFLSELLWMNLPFKYTMWGTCKKGACKWFSEANLGAFGSWMASGQVLAAVSPLWLHKKRPILSLNYCG